MDMNEGADATAWVWGVWGVVRIVSARKWTTRGLMILAVCCAGRIHFAGGRGGRAAGRSSAVSSATSRHVDAN